MVRAQKMKGSTAALIMQILESRLDNAVYRMGFAPSRSAARKLVLDGHIFVNKKRVRSPGYEVKPKDVVSIRTESVTNVPFKELNETLKTYEGPNWVSVDAVKLEGIVLRVPDDISAPFEINLLVESFSK